MRLAGHAARTGEPILRPLAYHHAGYEDVTDQFLLGEDLLAAPVPEQGAITRGVVVPPGRWTAPDGRRSTDRGTVNCLSRWRRFPGFAAPDEPRTALSVAGFAATA